MGLKDPIGQTIKVSGDNWHVVGVIKDMVMSSPYQAVQPTLFFFEPYLFSIISVKLNPQKSIQSALPIIKNIYEKHSPAFPFDFKFIDDEFNKKFQSEELIGKLANLFASFAIFISCLGLFGLAAFAAEQRQKEIGIRKTLGASVKQIASLLSKDFLKLVLIALLFASPIGYLTMEKWLETYPYRIEINWWIFILTGAIVLGITLITISFQAIKAAVANPVKSLRSE